MRIAFIFAPFSHRVFEEDIKTVSRDFGVYPPLGLAYAAGIAEKHGHKVLFIDANAERLTKEQAYKRLKSFKPQMLGFMLTTYMFRLTHAWIRYFKRQMPHVKVVVGNVNLEFYPRETLMHKEIDFGIIGPATENFPKLLEAIERNKLSRLSTIPGLAYRSKNRIIVNPPRTLKEDWERLPRLPRHLLPNERYYQFISQKRNFTIMVTSKGCPFNCSFCGLGNSPFSYRRINDVIGEIKECLYKYSVKEIDFFEALFTFNKKRVIELCKAIISNKLKFDWSCRSRVDTIDEEMLRRMKRAGCVRIYYGIESVSNEVLKNINKQTSAEATKKAVYLTHKYGIKALGFFMVGNPGDSAETVKRTIRFATKELNLDFIEVARTVAKPCSALHRELVKQTGQDYWRDYILYKVEEKRLPTPWTNLSEEEQEELVRLFYKRFYFRPSYIIRRLIDLNSFEELKRYTRSSIDVIFSRYRDYKIGDGN